MEQEKEILNLRIDYDLDLDSTHFRIRFIPKIGGEEKEGKSKRVGHKFIEILLDEFEKIYSFYETFRKKPVLREAKDVQISDLELDILSMIPGDTAIEKLETIGKKIHGLVPTIIKDNLKKISCVIISSKRFLVPFELMHDGDSFLATRIEFYRNPILGEKERPSISRKAKKLPGTVVFVTNPTEDLEAAEEEANRIINFFKNSEKKLNLKIKEYNSETASYNVLINTFPSHRLDIFHYCGHSKITKEDIYFKLKDDNLSVEDVVLRYPALFFLNMCEADVTVQHKVVFEGYKSLNFPIALMQKGAKACIATFWPIVDRSAADFATIFYQRVVEKGESFGTAICKAKETLESSSDPNDITWMSFVLYGDPRKAKLDGIIEELDKEVLSLPTEGSEVEIEVKEIIPATIGKKYAFLVGISESHFKTLPFATRHVNEFETILKDSNDFEEIIVLKSNESDIDHQPHTRNIMEQFSHLIEKIQNHDIIFIYFICYGGYFNKQNYIFPERKVKRLKLEELISDQSQDSYESDFPSIPLSYFDDELKTLNVKDWSAFFFLDIHQEELKEIKSSKIKPIIITKEEKVSGIARFWAFNAQTNANSFDEGGKNHSIFSYALLNGLKKDISKPITYGKLVNYLKIEVARIANDQNKIQEPISISLGPGYTKSLLDGAEPESIDDVVEEIDESPEKIQEIIDASPPTEKISPDIRPKAIDKTKNPYMNPPLKAAREKLKEIMKEKQQLREKLEETMKKKQEKEDAEINQKCAILINQLRADFKKIPKNYKDAMIVQLMDKISKAEGEEDEILVMIYNTALKSIPKNSE